MSMAFGCTRQSVLHAVSSRRVTGSTTSPRATKENLFVCRRPPVPLLELLLDSSPMLPQVDLPSTTLESPPPLYRGVAVAAAAPILTSSTAGLWGVVSAPSLPPVLPVLRPPTLPGSGHACTSTCTSIAVTSAPIAVALPALVSWSRRPQIDKGMCRPGRQPAATSSALPRTMRASSSSTATR